LSDQKNIGVVILYPALATPEILVGQDDDLEVLLLTQTAYSEGELRMRIRNQLKISSGLDPRKQCANRALFVDQYGVEPGGSQNRAIKIENIPFGTDQPVQTASQRFSGYIDKRIYKIYSDAGYTTLYRVSMSNAVLEIAMGDCSLSACGEPQDLIINTVLNLRSPWAKQNGEKYYCFGQSGNDLDGTRFDLSNPIQSYHPVFQYGKDDLQYANLGHLSDVHMASRQQVLAKSKARVIDYYAEKGSDAALESSPFIGNVINVCSRDMINILRKIGGSGADILLIGGDLVDFLRMCYLSPEIARDIGDGTPSRIWNAVALGDNYTEHYKDGPDMIGFLTILLNHCRTYSMPAYAITGNHDCYFLPYGLSPRVDAKVIERRPNEGIPSDHNLTFYEAILAFGETYGTLKSGLGFHSPFVAELFDWFYTVFTPFIDYSVELPKQHLVAVGWGDEEDLFDSPGTGHGFGHLPRAVDTISDQQLAMLDRAIQTKKKVILLTHFTFVSYDYPVPVSRGDQDLGELYIRSPYQSAGDINSGYFHNEEWNEYNSGAFQKNREKLLVDHCARNRNIQVILTGHSHRRALYLLERFEGHFDSMNQTIKIRHFDLNSFDSAKKLHSDMMEPAIVVSDSGGTIPRYNYGGEFKGRGSDPPSGTLLAFDQGTGALTAVRALPTDLCRPRIAVAVDYLDIQEDDDVIVKFESDPFSIEDEASAMLPGLTFAVELGSHMKKRSLYVESVVLFSKSSLKGAWDQVVMTDAGQQRFTISGGDVSVFCDFIASNYSRGNFLAMKFRNPQTPETRGYDFSSPWCWEFEVHYQLIGAWAPFEKKKYMIVRNKKRAEIPDFDWRRKNLPAKYNQ
jgi:hypothetical protein